MCAQSQCAFAVDRKRPSQDIIPLLDDVLPQRNGFLVMLKAFLDRGAKKDETEEIVSVGCVVFRPTAYRKFIRPWKRMLKPWGADAFHATDFYNGAEEFKRNNSERERLFAQDSKRIPLMIGRHMYMARTISFNPAEFLQTAPPGYIDLYGTSVHSHAVQMCLVFNGFWRQDTCPSESFAYFMESGDPGIGDIAKSVEQMRNNPTTGPLIKVSSFNIIDKGDARGTDAADFVAWHWNKYYIDKVKTGKPLEARKDFKAFVEASKLNKLKYSMVTGNYLREFFSIVPIPDW